MTEEGGVDVCTAGVGAQRRLPVLRTAVEALWSLQPSLAAP